MAPSEGARKSYYFLLVGTFLSGVSARSPPFRVPSPPSFTCPLSSSWQYSRGRSYNFRYETTTTTSMRGASDQESVVTMAADARVTVSAESPCLMKLQLSNVDISDDSSTSFAAALGRSPLSFVFEDGKVTSVFTETGYVNWEEDSYVNNIKKGVLSAFQNAVVPTSTEDVDEATVEVQEVDVSGSCPTTYSGGPRVDGGTVQTFKKTKDLSRCRDGQKIVNHNFNLPDIKQVSLLQSTHDCTFGTTEGLLMFSDCYERHSFNPFDASKTGATTEQRRKLTFISDYEDEANSRNFYESPRPTSLLFESAVMLSPEDEEKDADLRRALEAATKLSAARDSSRQDLFNALLDEMKKLDVAGLFDLFNLASNRDDVLDALPMLGTEEAAEYMVVFLLAGRVDEERQDRWFDTLAFYKTPTRVMISSLSIFLASTTNVRPSFYLGSAILTNTFCQSNPDCLLMPEVRSLVEGYEGQLGRTCNAMGREEEETVILSLKALRNLGFATSSGLSVITECVSDPWVPARIRLAAIDTAAFLGCRMKNHLDLAADVSKLNKIVQGQFADRSADSELRIAAYMGLMTCPDQQTVQHVKKLLAEEEVNQVGSFVWTHLTNMQESLSHSTSRKHLKKLIGQEFLKNKWNTDVRKFSRFLETSYFPEGLGAGATLDGSVVFSQDSYLPRSTRLNLTVDVFGQSLNLFEVGVRAEGFEPIVEDLFGPEGYFREDTFHKMLQGMRAKRDNSISSFQQMFNTRPEEKKPSGEMSLRFLGKDLKYKSFDGLGELAWMLPSGLTGSTPTTFSRSSLFLDSSVTIPTSAGLPLSLAVNGTYKVDLSFNVRLSASKLFSSGEADVRAEIYPTGFLDVVGVMGVNAYTTRTGLKARSRLHSSTFLDGSATLRGHKLVSAALNMPRDKAQVLEASVDFFTYENGAYVEQKSIHKASETELCTPDVISDLFAVQGCADIRYHRDKETGQVLAGPLRVTVDITKTDTFDKYSFIYAWEETASKNEESQLTSISATLDTPGSLRSHKTGLGITFDNIYRYFSLDFDLPYKEVKVQAKYEWASDEKRIKASVAAGGQSVGVLNCALSSKRPDRLNILAKLSYFDKDLADYSASVYVQNNKGSIDGRFASSFHRPLLLSGNWQARGNDLSVFAGLKSTDIELAVTGEVRKERHFAAVTGEVSYVTPGSSRRTYGITGKYKNPLSGSLERHEILLSFDHPDFYSELTWDFQQSEGYLENNAHLQVGDRRFSLQQIYSSQHREDLLEHAFKIKLEDEARGGEYMVDHFVKMTPTNYNHRLALSYGQLFRFEAFLDFLSKFSPLHHRIDVALRLPHKLYKAAGQIRETETQDYSGDLEVAWGEESSRQLSADFVLQRSNVEQGYSKGHYTVLSNVRVRDWSPLRVEGVLKFERGIGSLARVWIRGPKEYKLEIQHMVISPDSEYGIYGNLQMDDVTYNSVVVYRFDDLMSAIQADINMERKISMTFMTRSDFKDISFTFHWDKDRDDSRKVVLKAQLLPSKLLAEYSFPTTSGLIEGSLDPDQVRLRVGFNEHFLETEGKWRFSEVVCALRGSVKSSFPALEALKISGNVHRQRQGDAFEVISKASVQWNDARHAASMKAHVRNSGFDVDARSESTYEVVDDFRLQARCTDRQDKLETQLRIKYQDVEMLLGSLKVKRSSPSVELRVRSPFAVMKSLLISFSLSDNKVRAQFDRNGEDKFDLNASANLAHKDNQELSFKVVQTFGPNVTFNFLGSEEVLMFDFAGTSGEYGMKVFASQRPGVKHQLIVRKICPTRPFVVNATITESQEGNFLSGTIDVGHERVGQVTWRHSRKKGTEFDLEGTVKVGTHELFLLARKNDKGANFTTKHSVQEVEQWVSQLTVSQTSDDDVKVNVLLQTQHEKAPHLSAEVLWFRVEKDEAKSAVLRGTLESLETRASILYEWFYVEDVESGRKLRLTTNLPGLRSASVEHFSTGPSSNNKQSLSITNDGRDAAIELKNSIVDPTEQKRLVSLITRGSLIPEALRLSLEVTQTKPSDHGEQWTLDLLESSNTHHILRFSVDWDASNVLGVSKVIVDLESPNAGTFCQICSGNHAKLSLEWEESELAFSLTAPSQIIGLHGRRTSLDGGTVIDLDLSGLSLPSYRAKLRHFGSLSKKQVGFSATVEEIEGELEVNLVGEADWRHRDVKVDASLRTSFYAYGMEDSGFSVSVTESSTLKQIEAEVYGDNKRCTGAVIYDLSQGSASLELKSDLFRLIRWHKVKAQVLGMRYDNHRHEVSVVLDDQKYTMAVLRESDGRVEASLWQEGDLSSKLKLVEVEYRFSGLPKNLSMKVNPASDHEFSLTAAYDGESATASATGRVPFVGEPLDLRLDVKPAKEGHFTVKGLAGDADKILFLSHWKVTEDQGELVVESFFENFPAISFNVAGEISTRRKRLLANVAFSRQEYTLVLERGINDIVKIHVTAPLSTVHKFKLDLSARTPLSWSLDLMLNDWLSSGQLNVSPNLWDEEMLLQLSLSSPTLGVNTFKAACSYLKSVAFESELTWKDNLVFQASAEGFVNPERIFSVVTVKGINSSVLFQGMLNWNAENIDAKADFGDWKVEAALNYNLAESFIRGDFSLDGEITTRNRGHDFKLAAHYNFSGSKKTLSLESEWNKDFVKLATETELTGDGFTSLIDMTSSLSWLKSVATKASCLIKAEPEIVIEAVFNGTPAYITARVNLEQTVPTVFITSTISGLESIVLSGDYHKNESSYLTLRAERNGKMEAEILGALKYGEGHFDLHCTVKTPSLPKQSTKLGLSLSWRDPYSMKAYVDGTYTLDATVSLESRELDVHVKSPIEGLRTISLVGRAGRTSSAKSFGVSFDQGGQKYDLGLDYALEDDATTLSVQLPGKDLKRVALVQRYKREDASEEADFQFEADGEDVKFKLAVKYDLNVEKHYVKVGVVASPPELEFTFSASWDDQIEVSAYVLPLDESIELLVDLESSKLNFTSSSLGVLQIEPEPEAKELGWIVTIVSPLLGELTAKVNVERKLVNKFDLEVSLNGRLLSFVSASLTPEVTSLSGTVQIGRHRGHLQADFKDHFKRGQLTLETSGLLEKFNYSYGTETLADKTTYRHQYRLTLSDSHFYAVEAEREVTRDSVVGRETVTTNFRKYGYTQQITNYYMERHANSRLPKSFFVKVTRDEELFLDAEASLTPTSNGFQSSFTLKLPQGSVPVVQGTVKFSSDHGHSTLAFDSNIPGLESVQADVNSGESKDAHGLAEECVATLTLNGKEIALVEVSRTINEKNELVVALTGRYRDMQTISYSKVTGQKDGKFYFDQKLSLEGSLINISSTFTINIDFVSSKAESDISVEGVNPLPCSWCPSCGAEFEYNFGIEFDRRNKRLRAVVTSPKEKVEHRLQISYNVETITRILDLGIDVESSCIDPVSLALSWALLPDGPKNVQLKVVAGSQVSLQVSSSFLWTWKESKMSAQVTYYGQSLVFLGRRQNYVEKMRYTLKASEHVLLDFRNQNIIKSPTDVEVNAALAIPLVLGPSGLKVKVKVNAVTPSKIAVAASTKHDFGEAILIGRFSRDAFDHEISLEVVNASKNPLYSLVIAGKEETFSVDSIVVKEQSTSGTHEVILKSNLRKWLQTATLREETITVTVAFPNDYDLKGSITVKLSGDKEARLSVEDGVSSGPILVVVASMPETADEEKEFLINVKGTLLQGQEAVIGGSLTCGGSSQEVEVKADLPGLPQIVAKAHLEYSSTSVTFQGSLASPVLADEEVSISFNLESEGERKRGLLNIRWPPNKKLSASFDLIKYTSLIVEAETPSSQYKKIEFKASAEGTNTIETSLRVTDSLDTPMLGWDTHISSSKYAASFEMLQGNILASDLYATMKVDVEEQSIFLQKKFAGTETSLRGDVQGNELRVKLRNGPYEADFAGTWTVTPTGIVVEATGTTALNHFDLKMKIGKDDKNDRTLTLNLTKDQEANVLSILVSHNSHHGGQEVKFAGKVLDQHVSARAFYQIDGTLLKIEGSLGFSQGKTYEVRAHAGYSGRRNLEFSIDFSERIQISFSRRDKPLLHLSTVFNYERFENLHAEIRFNVPLMNVGDHALKIILRAESMRDFEVFGSLSINVKSYSYGVKFVSKKTSLDASVTFSHSQNETFEAGLFGEYECIADSQLLVKANVHCLNGPTKYRATANLDLNVASKALDLQLTGEVSDDDRLVHALRADAVYRHGSRLKWELVATGQDDDLSGEKKQFIVVLLSLLKEDESNLLRGYAATDFFMSPRASMSVQLQRKGEFDLKISVRDKEQPVVRVKRSADQLWTRLGQHELVLGQTKESQGTLLLRTGGDLHQVTFDVESMWDFSVQVVSPVLSEDAVTLDVSIDPWKTSVCRCSVIAGKNVLLLISADASVSRQFSLRLIQSIPIMPETSLLSFLNQFNVKLFTSQDDWSFFLKYQHGQRNPASLTISIKEMVHLEANFPGFVTSTVSVSRDGPEAFDVHGDVRYDQHVHAQLKGKLHVHSKHNWNGIFDLVADVDKIAYNKSVTLSYDWDESPVIYVTVTGQGVDDWKVAISAQHMIVETPTDLWPLAAIRWKVHDSSLDVKAITQRGIYKYSGPIFCLSTLKEMLASKREVKGSFSIPEFGEPVSFTVKIRSLENDSFGVDVTSIADRAKFFWSIDAAWNVESREGRLSCNVFEDNRLVGGAKFSVAASKKYEILGSLQLLDDIYQVNVAFANSSSERRLRAFYKWPQEACGLSLEGTYHSVKNFHFDGRVDLPWLPHLPGLQVGLDDSGLVLSLGQGFTEEKSLRLIKTSTGGVETYDGIAKWDSLIDWKVQLYHGPENVRVHAEFGNDLVTVSFSNGHWWPTEVQIEVLSVQFHYYDRKILKVFIPRSEIVPIRLLLEAVDSDGDIFLRYAIEWREVNFNVRGSFSDGDSSGTLSGGLQIDYGWPLSVKVERREIMPFYSTTILSVSREWDKDLLKIVSTFSGPNVNVVLGVGNHVTNLVINGDMPVFDESDLVERFRTVRQLRWKTTGGDDTEWSGVEAVSDFKRLGSEVQRTLTIQRLNSREEKSITVQLDDGPMTQIAYLRVRHPQERYCLGVTVKFTTVVVDEMSPLPSSYRISTFEVTTLNGLRYLSANYFALSLKEGHQTASLTAELLGDVRFFVQVNATSHSTAIQLGSSEMNNNVTMVKAEISQDELPSVTITFEDESVELTRIFLGFETEDVAALRIRAPHQEPSDKIYADVVLSLQEDHILVLEGLWDFRGLQHGWNIDVRRLRQIVEFCIPEIHDVLEATRLSLSKFVHESFSDAVDFASTALADQRAFRQISHDAKNVLTSLTPYVDPWASAAFGLGSDMLRFGMKAQLASYQLALKCADSISEFARFQVHMTEEARTQLVTNIVDGVARTLDSNFGVKVGCSLKDLLTNYGQILHETSRFYDTWIKNAIPRVALNLSTWAEDLQRTALVWLSESYTRLRPMMARPGITSLVRNLGDLYVTYRSWLEEVHVSYYLDQALGHLSSIFDAATSAVSKVSNFISDLWTRRTQFTSSHLISLDRVPALSYWTTMAKRSWNALMTLFGEYTLADNLQEYVSMVAGQVDVVTTLMIHASRIIYQEDPLFSFEYTFDPKEGHLYYKQAQPLIWDSLQDGPRLLTAYQYSPKGGLTFQDFQHDVLDVLNTLNNAIVTKTIFPPFSAHALIMPSALIRSFDGKVLSFNGQCSHLLTADFVHSRFFIIGHYVEGKRTGLSILSDGRIIELRTDTKVTVDGRQLSIPQNLGRIVIKWSGSSKIVMESQDGLRVQCNTLHGICSVTVSGWYFGKTGGLLGVYDNEPFNDWTSPSREVIQSNGNEVAQSWSLGDRHCATGQSPEEKVPTLFERQACQDLFASDSSALMPCFETVETDTFLQMCLNQMARERNDPRQSTEALCSAAISYVEYCGLKGIELWPPSECVTCRQMTRANVPMVLQVGESMSYHNDTPSSADVIFIMQQKSCMREFYLEDLPQLIDRTLEEQHLRNNRFAMLGFGDTRGLDGAQILSAVGADIFDDMRKITFKSRHLSSTPNQPGEVLEALQVSARLPFRAGVSKNLIFLTCTENQLGWLEGSSFGDALTLVMEQNIKVHHLSNMELHLRKGTAAKTMTSRILGYDKLSVFTTADASPSSSGNPELRRQLLQTKDLLSALAVESGGSVFALQTFHSSSASFSSKLAGTVLAARVATQAEPAACQVCDCLADRDGRGGFHCHRCILPEVDIVLRNWERLNGT